MKLLVIEDSERLRRSLRQGLSKTGFVVDFAVDGKEGLAFCRTNEYDVIVLDLMLPQLDGMTVLKTLREEGNTTPVLILSARDQLQDRVSGLDIGADDYLVKPFAFDELCARIKAIARRRFESESPLVVIGGITVDVGKRQVLARGQSIALTPTEYGIIECLVLNRGRVLSKDKLLDQLRSSEIDVTSNVVEVFVSNLRKKLSEVGIDELIITRRGYGYVIE